MASRNLSNEIKQETVNALIEACESYFPVVQEYYQLKAKLLGLETLYDYDRYAPVLPEVMPRCDWKTCQDIIHKAYAAFSPKAAEIVEKEKDPKVKLSLLCGKIEDSFATVFRQIILTRFEQKLHHARRSEGELTAERIGGLWIEANQPMHGSVVKLSENYAWWWLYISHFIHTPFYCYAYAFGELLVLSLYQQYQREGERFVAKYMKLLASGGSDSPQNLLKPLGIDTSDPHFWKSGLELLQSFVVEAKRLAQQV